jgi:tetratricopeptide (TPR) repeat protein
LIQRCAGVKGSECTLLAADANVWLGQALLELERYREALHAFERAEGLYRAANTPAVDGFRALPGIGMGQAWLAQGHVALARDFLESALALLGPHREPATLAQAQFGLARADVERARALGREAEANFTRAGDRRSRQVRGWLAGRN